MWPPWCRDMSLQEELACPSWSFARLLTFDAMDVVSGTTPAGRPTSCSCEHGLGLVL